MILKKIRFSENDGKMNKLLPHRLKIFGWLLVGLGTSLTIIYFVYGLRLIFPVFAIYSAYLETKILTTFNTNIGDELILLSFITGFLIISLSKEKEEIKSFKIIRIKALQKTVLIYFSWLIATVLFVYGNGFISVLILNTILPFIIYLALFHILKRREIKKRRLRSLQNKIIKGY